MSRWVCGFGTWASIQVSVVPKAGCRQGAIMNGDKVPGGPLERGPTPHKGLCNAGVAEIEDKVRRVCFLV